MVKPTVMEPKQILHADVLDIIFDDRNKAYGAYELRRKYQRRLLKAMLVTGSLVLGVMLASFVSSRFVKKDEGGKIAFKEVELTDLTQEIKNEPPAVIPPKPVEPPRVAMSQFTPPKIVRDEDVKPEEEMKDVEQMQDTKIGTRNQDGNLDEGVVAPPIEENSGVVSAPKKSAEDEVFNKVEIEAQFPGGERAWIKYIQREIERYMDELTEEGQSGTVMIQFIVDREGKISDVEALTMKGTKLAEIAVNAVRKGPNWKPAEQNGQMVKAYRRQPVVFRIPEE